MIQKACYIEVDAGVRYWEDAYLNGQEDKEGQVPGRTGERWLIIIDLESGSVLNWPKGIEAKVHYKVCDDGQYWLLDKEQKRISQWNGYYVPDDILCINDEGFGDYIIFTINNNGIINNWKKPNIDAAQWNLI